MRGVTAMFACFWWVAGLLFPTTNAWAGVCEGCANPRVEVRPIHFTGDVPESLQSYIRSGGGWERAWAWLNFKNRNPCADISFVMDAGWKPPETLGPGGVPGYHVESTMHFSKADPGDRTLVMRQSGWDGNEYRKSEPVLVPILGRIEVRHDLRALKSGQIYDSAQTRYDWVGDPPEGSTEFLHDGPAVIDGKTYQPADGIFIGEFSPSAAVEEEIHFSLGDIGLTIRKKETPSAGSLQVDDGSMYPPYYLIEVTEIQNQFGEPMPDQIPLALRMDEGEIDGGEPLGGWKLFTTQGAALPAPIRYRTPKCAPKTRKAVIELADVCHWHEFSHLIRQPRFRRSADLPVCGTFKGTIHYQRNVHWKDESTQPSGKMVMSVNLTETATLFVTAKHLRNVKDSSGVSELYEARPLAGRCSVSMKKITLITDKKGNWSKTVDTWQGGNWMRPEDASNLLVTIEPRQERYTIQGAIIFPPVEGTTEITSSRGMRSTMPAESWAINAGFDVDGSTDGAAVSGTWSQPAAGNTAVTATTGLLPGTTWNWRLKRVGE